MGWTTVLMAELQELRDTRDQLEQKLTAAEAQRDALLSATAGLLCYPKEGEAWLKLEDAVSLVQIELVEGESVGARAPSSVPATLAVWRQYACAALAARFGPAQAARQADAMLVEEAGRVFR